jgi:hypothetical protein
MTVHRVTSQVRLKAFTDLAGAVIMVDALPTQSDTAQAITGRPCSRRLTCILLSPITLAGIRTYKPRAEGRILTRDALHEGHSSTGNGDGNVTWRWYKMKVQSRSCTAGIGTR